MKVMYERLRKYFAYQPIENYMLTSEFEAKAQSYELRDAGLLSCEGADHVMRNLHGADKLASAFGITLKGIQTLAQLFPDDEECLDMQRQVIKYVWAENTYGNNVLKILDRREHYTRGNKSPIFFKKV